MAVAGERRTPQDRRRLAFSLWSVATIAAWGVAWVIYAAVVELGTCVDIFANPHGGRVHSIGWAGFTGFLLMLLAVTLAFRWRRRLLLLFAAFVTVYAAGLFVLWAVSHAIWGPARCTGG